MPSTATPDSGDHTLARLVIVAVAVLLLAPVFIMALGMPVVAGMGWGWHDGAMVGMAPWWGVGMGIGWLLVLIAVGFVAYRALAAGGHSAGTTDPAIRELRLAYARGELTDEEFEARRSVLAADRPDEP